MTEADFRKLALSLEGAIESSHLGHTDFRINSKIFATLPFEDDEDAKGNVPGGVGVVKLTPDQQDAFVAEFPAFCEPVPGGWGRQGYTRVLLARAPTKVVRRLLETASRNIARKAAANQPSSAVRKAKTRPKPKRKIPRQKPRD
ncbi:MAG: MmcQ/YjbR family DNA-binding protein [Planctomycetes bacterium]|nr:MmcQ/YjbR family DNA-binding protein [Planctomycetota bacterium]